MNFERFSRVLATLSLVAVFGLGPFIPAALAGSTVSITSDTAVLLSGSDITLLLAAGSSMVSYSADASTLTLGLDVGSNVTLKSNDLYTLTNTQSQPTQCSASPAYSYASFSATGPETVTITPTLTVACSNTAPVIGTFGASPVSITSGQTSLLSWSLSGADTVSIDNGIGPQSNASSSSTSVSPSQTTTYTLTASNYIGTTTAQTTVTVTAPPSGGGGGGGGGSVIAAPTIGSFLASPASVLAGQSSTLSWIVTGASTVSITPAVSTGSLNPLSGTATVTPTSTTTYTLVASNAYGQSVSAATTITGVMAGNSGSQLSPITPQQPNEPTPAATSTAPAYCLVNHAGTFFLILNGIRHGVANPGLLYSYGYGFGDAVADTAVYQNLPSGDLLGPDDGALVKSPGDPTVFLISGRTKHAFTSASVFRGLGYKFPSVLTIPAPQLNALPGSSLVDNTKACHLQGANVNDHGAIYYLGQTQRLPYPSVVVFNTWNLRNDFSRVLPANDADLALPIGPVVPPRSSCLGQ